MDPREAISPDEARRIILARMLAGDMAGKAAAPIPPRDPAAPVPLSAEQSQLWLHAALAPHVPLYNESITIHRLGPYNHTALEAALSEITRRHAIWRTAFVEDGGELVQRIADPAPLTLPIIDISHLPAAARDAEAVRLASDDARAPIALDTAPLFRARVIKLAAEDHRLYITLHHIIFDGVSIYKTLVPELSALVAAYEVARPSPLPEPALQYADYAAWQVANRDEGETARQIGWWRTQLAEPLPRLELASDRPRPGQPTHAGSMANFSIGAVTLARLKALAGAEGASLYQVMLAGFKAMLFRYTGDTDIIVGGVTDTRRRPELQPLMGYFLNTMALRSHPRGELPFRAYLAEVRGSLLGALGHSDVPFNQLIRALDIKRGEGTHPLFNVLFSIEPPVDPFPPGWDLTQMDVTVGAAKYDLYLELDERHAEHGGGMVGRFLYSSELFDAAMIERMIGHYIRLVEGVAADADTPLADLPMLGADECAALAAWNDTAAPLPHASIADWFAETAAHQPAAIALRHGDTAWTYAELSAQADAVAARLAAEGVAAGDLVGLCVTRSAGMVAAMLGIARAGAAYLPLDPGFPRARLAMIAQDAAPRLVLVEPETREAVAGIGAPLRDLDIMPSPMEQGLGGGVCPGDSGEPAAPHLRGGELAYVLYTSGSTGRPKGVEISHAALVNLLAAMAERPGFAPGQSLLAITTLSFDIAGLEIWLPLMLGGTVILADRETAIDMNALAALIDATGPDVMQATPATWRGLVEAGWEGRGDLKILCGGEALPRVLAEQLLPRCAELWNVYGPTETTIWSTAERVSHGTGPVPIGQPIANTQCHIRDAGGNDRPIGAVGELLIGGAGLAAGYRGRADLTAEKFISQRGERLYRTGDLAKWRADGTLVCLGRTDHEEKIRGFRVAIEEIEAALARIPGIAAVAVRAWPDASGERALAAYVVGLGDPALWRDTLAETLPDYMIPARYVLLDALPLTPNGKVDRNALPEPGAALARQGEPPATPAEARLAGLWAKVLKLEAVNRDDDFFDLGGHSLLIARLLRLIEADYGERIPMAALFRAPRLADMAALIESGRHLDSPALVPIQPHGGEAPIFWLDGGSTMLPLTAQLGGNQPFFGISVDALLEVVKKKPKRLDDIAALVVEEILKLRPEGPYRLGGWCSSGIVAWSVAAQLQARGKPVDVLLLAHAFHPVKAREIGALRFFTSKLRFHLGHTMAQPGGARLGYFFARLIGMSDAAGLRGGREAVLRPEIRTAIDKAAFKYVPAPITCAVLLIQPADHPDVLDFAEDWRLSAGGPYAAHTVAGGHRTMLEEPHISEFAGLVRVALAGWAG